MNRRALWPQSRGAGISAEARQGEMRRVPCWKEDGKALDETGSGAAPLRRCHLSKDLSPAQRKVFRGCFLGCFKK